MRKFAGIFILILFTFAAFGQKKGKDTDWKNDNLFGQIKTVQTIEYTAFVENNIIQKGDTINTLIEKYNEAGYLSEQAEYNPDGSLMQKEIFDYDRKNNRITDRLYAENNQMEQRIDITYNAMRLPAKELVKDVHGKKIQKTTYLYNEKGELTRLTVYDDRGKMTERSYYSYDQKGNLIRYVGYGEFDNRKISHTFDAENRLAESLTLDLEGNFVERTAYRYDSLSVEKTYFDKENKPLKKEYFVFDRYENLLTIRFFDKDENITESHSFVYQYDTNNNWTTQITYTGSEQRLTSIAERIIEYY
jgi:hypothetical protein